MRYQDYIQEVSSNHLLLKHGLDEIYARIGGGCRLQKNSLDLSEYGIIDVFWPNPPGNGSVLLTVAHCYNVIGAKWAAPQSDLTLGTPPAQPLK